MPAQWLSNTSDASGRVSESLESTLRLLSKPKSVRYLRIGLLLLLGIWVLYSIATLFWSLFPAAEPESPDVAVINPVSRQQSRAAPVEIDLEQMRQWHLFGEAGAAPVAEAEPVIEERTSSARDGIEKGARETRLELKLRGVVASTEDGLGHAIIEHRKKQAVYAVEDKMPVSGQVTLAKVMPRQVVLDNGGTYELLVLFEETELDSQSVAPAPRVTPVSKPAEVDKRTDEKATELAQGYRDRLYQNPQSLAEVVSVSAVRRDGQLEGYRIAPGKDKDQFSQLGFESGDLVTRVNGIALNDPANTMRLYQTLRTATEAVFDLRRGEQQVSISVSLGDQDETPEGM